MRLIHTIQKAAVVLLLTALITLVIPAQRASAAYLTSAAGQVTTSFGSLYVRDAAGTHGSVIGRLPSGSYVTLISKAGNWWRVEYAPNVYGYVSGDYIRYVYGTYTLKTATSSGNLNVRSGPGTSYAAIGSISNGQVVLVLEKIDGWYKVLYNGVEVGYASGLYLKSLMAWPVPASYKINQYFSNHNGIDIGSSVRGVPGDAVIAAQQGKVVYAGWLNGYGYVVYINSVHNGQPIQTRYGHLMSAPIVTPGQTVGVGQTIGYMGNTGTSTGVHLHFEVRLRNASTDCIANSESTPVNPMDYIQ